MNGEELSSESVNSVKDVPEGFTKWVEKNAGRIQAAEKRGTLPYFIKDNNDFVKDISSKPPEEYKFDREELEKRGFTLNEYVTEQTFNERIKGFNLNEFDDEMTEVAKTYGFTWATKEVEHNRDIIDIDMSGSNGIKLRRRYSKGSVSHELFTIPEDMQGKGLSKEVFKALYKQYKNAGIQEINVHANIDVGGSTWAKYGFVAKPESFNRLVSQFNRSRRKGKIDDDQLAYLTRWIEQYRDKNIPLHELVDKDYFTKMMEWSDWQGFIDFRDENQKKIFEEYLYKKK
jgi:GNAT superfamily N-acetyltransferase